MPDELHDPQTGIPIRFIRRWETDPRPMLTEEDVFRLRAYMERQFWERQFALPSPPEDR